MLKHSFVSIIIIISSISFANDNEVKKLESIEVDQENSILLFDTEINNPSETDHNKTDTTESNCSDKMVLRDGTIIECSIIKEEDDRIFYKKCSDKLGRKFAKKKEYISKIIYEDGKEVDYSAYEATAEMKEKKKQKDSTVAATAATAVGAVLIVVLLAVGGFILFIWWIGRQLGLW